MHLRWQRVGVVGFVVGHSRSAGGDTIKRKNATQEVQRYMKKKKNKRRHLKAEPGGGIDF